MAYEISNYSLKISLVAGQDFTGLPYRFVKLNGAGQAVLCSAAIDLPIGIIQNTPPLNSSCEVLVSGGSKLVAGATITAGAVVATSATGTGVPIVHGTDTTKFAVGAALTSGASGEVITVVVACHNAGRAA